ncbi:MAG TPA: winged helix-turn-helix domain-containing protein [Capillimicrobium sp.]|nr:winged helix-turn-helix domain-containing protein [Capillimicrobium sp.]
MADFLDEKKREIAARLDELRPLVDEYQRLEAAQRALEGVGANGTAPARTGGRRRASSGGGSGSGRRGRPRGTGTRSKQALELVQANPGITIPELAERMGIKQNYLYRVLPGLEQDGLVRKEGRGWHPQVAA